MASSKLAALRDVKQGQKKNHRISPGVEFVCAQEVCALEVEFLEKRVGAWAQ